MELPGGGDLIQKTFARALGLAGVDEVLTVTNRELYFKTVDEYRQVSASGCRLGFILEPFGRNTAPAIAAAALHIAATHGSDAVMLVLPADHLIEDVEAFASAVEQARQLAEQGWLVTFGIQPERPETGYGYIQIDRSANLGLGYKVQRFVEKPDSGSAQDYVASGNYLWNSGMFCFEVGMLIDELKRCAPDVLQSVEACMQAGSPMDGNGRHSLELAAETFARVPDISIDYALMERSDKVATIPCSIGWKDIGSWSAMSSLVAADANGNRLAGEVLVHESANNYVQSAHRLTALVGVDDLIVVDTPDAVLVAHKDRVQDVKHIVSELKSKGHQAHLMHRTVHRPWGSYTTLEEGQRFKIKRLVVKPKASLSLQMHHHRSEHWTVVSGMARVINGTRDIMLDTNESTFISAGHKHRLENPGVIDLVLIEVQSGDYLGEDDIVRFDDAYGRAGA
ncbi:Alginate biosynthesis protein AlgA [Pseudomonas carbonaria]|uniref:Alginate biosynthesis protein AlgA n=2 Tax=Zestomonas carbonaria TaxID=2762745 RepID=A0A7U7EJ23_9GAMM|nr:Alginate biosynthesis protein AlgA [Pseudomonas carbonaria]